MRSETQITSHDYLPKHRIGLNLKHSLCIELIFILA